MTGRIRARLCNRFMKHTTIHLESQTEPFIDHHLVDHREGVSLKLHQPVRREIVFPFDQPWEKRCPGYCSFLKDPEGRIRLYYRAQAMGGDFSDQQTTGLAFSEDGIHFERPKFGLVEFEGSKENNLIWRGVEAHNLAPFIDTNPDAPPESLYKATGGPMWKLFGLESADGIAWRKIQDEPLDQEGVFDSHNVVFWDSHLNCYRCFSRYFEGGWPKGIRAIQSATSKDFIHWSQPQFHIYNDGIPLEHFYTNATIQYPGHSNLLLSFPKRFVYERTVVPGHKPKGVSDAIFMSSRDGTHWNRNFAEAWIWPGPDLLNWTERCNMIYHGMFELEPGEWSLYIGEHHRCEDQRVRRLTVRRHGFASVHAGFHGGEFTTPPLLFSGGQLRLNYSTSAAGQIQVEIQEANGKPMEGFSLQEMEPVYGDQLDQAMVWKNGGDLSKLAGTPVRLRFVMREADLFSLRMASGDDAGNAS